MARFAEEYGAAQDYVKGDVLFSAPAAGSTAKRLGPSPWAVEVWYEAPVAPMQINSLPYDQQPLLMTFAGQLAGHSTNVLIDNGAA